MNRSDILAILPYGEDFLWVDRIVKLREPDERVTEFDYRIRSSLLAAHFASGPKVVPGALIIEQIFQSAQFLARRIGVVRSDCWLVPRKITAKLHTAAYTVYTIGAHVHVEQPVFDAFLFTGTAYDHEQKVASAKVTGKLMALHSR